MIQTLAVFDDFCPDLLNVRKEVIAGGFGTETGPDGLEYTGISMLEFPRLFEALNATFGAVKVIPRLSCFRLNLAGEKPHSWIHSDDICATYASVLYMNLPTQCKGGTAFWKHRGLGIDRMPSQPEIAACNYDLDWFLSMMKREWNDLTYWDQSGFAGMKWNRFITYPTSMFHSRYPFEPFGTTPDDGRLIWVCFFDVAPISAPVTPQPVEAQQAHD